VILAAFIARSVARAVALGAGAIDHGELLACHQRRGHFSLTFGLGFVHSFYVYDKMKVPLWIASMCGSGDPHDSRSGDLRDLPSGHLFMLSRT